MEIDELCRPDGDAGQAAAREASGYALPPGTWRCLVCQKPSNNMKVLPCNHKFCNECLRLWAGIYVDMYRGTHGEFPCQVCWKLFSVPIQGLEAYEQDYQLRVLQDNMQRMSMGQGQGQTTPGGSGPFSYTPNVPQQTSIIPTNQTNSPGLTNAFGEPMNNIISEPWGPNPGPNCDTGPSAITTQMMESNASSHCASNNCNPGQLHSLEGSTSAPGQLHSLEGSTSASYPSMVSHMVPGPVMMPERHERGEMDMTLGPGPGYCMRSCHLYMHMV